jgi:hypothetical protein
LKAARNNFIFFAAPFLRGASKTALTIFSLLPNGSPYMCVTGTRSLKKNFQFKESFLEKIDFEGRMVIEIIETSSIGIIESNFKKRQSVETPNYSQVTGNIK